MSERGIKGFGHLFDEFGNEYSGEFGSYQYENGDVYEGEFREGLRHGQARLIVKSSEVIFDCKWQNGMQHGSGRILYSNEQVFVRGKRYGQVEIRTKEGIAGRGLVGR